MKAFDSLATTWVTIAAVMVFGTASAWGQARLSSSSQTVYATKLSKDCLNANPAKANPTNRPDCILISNSPEDSGRVVTDLRKQMPGLNSVPGYAAPMVGPGPTFLLPGDEAEARNLRERVKALSELVDVITKQRDVARAQRDDAVQQLAKLQVQRQEGSK